MGHGNSRVLDTLTGNVYNHYGERMRQEDNLTTKTPGNDPLAELDAIGKGSSPSTMKFKPYNGPVIPFRTPEKKDQ